MNLCKVCNFNLDIGDIYEVLLSSGKYKTPDRALSAAKQYGWSESNKLRFDRSVLVKNDSGILVSICPKCDTVISKDEETSIRKTEDTLQAKCIQSIKTTIHNLPTHLQEEIVDSCKAGTAADIRMDVETKFKNELASDVACLVSTIVQNAIISNQTLSDTDNDLKQYWWSGWDAMYSPYVVDISKTCVKKILFVLNRDGILSM